MKNTFRIIDTHAHLDEIEDLEQVLAEARGAGLVAVIAVGSNMASNIKTLEIAARYPGFVYAALGWHPWYIRKPDVGANLEFIESNIDLAVAVGEIGLDYHKKVRAGADKDLQQNVLREILTIAKRHSKPALVHSRYAWRDAFQMVREYGPEKAVFHWYTGTSGVLKEIIEQDYYISVTPAVEYHEEHRRAVKEAPPERLLLETDCPVVYARGRENEFTSAPADVVRSLKGAAALKGLSKAEIAQVTTQNAAKLFGII
jgi:TatD DNase family protein